MRCYFCRDVISTKGHTKDNKKVYQVKPLDKEPIQLCSKQCLTLWRQARSRELERQANNEDNMW